MKNRELFRVAIGLALALLLTPAVPVSADDPLPEAIRNQMNRMVGVWDYAFEVDGKSYQGVWNVRWAPSKVALVSNFEMSGDSETVTGNLLTSWNAATEEIVEVTTSDGRGLLVARYRLVSDDLLKGVGTGSTPDGKKRTVKLKTEMGDDEFTWTNYDVTEDGKPVADRTLKFVRRTEMEPTPEWIKDHFKTLTGTWSYEFEVDGKNYSGTWRANVSNDGLTLDGRFEDLGPDGKVIGHTISGWDPESKRLVASDYLEGRGRRTRTFERRDDGSLVGTGEQWLPNGKLIPVELEFKQKGDQFDYRINIPVIGDQPAAVRRLTFKRVK